MNGAPWFHLTMRLGRKHVDLRLPPLWWNARKCKHGDCAYGNFWCPNGCKEWVELDA